MRYQVCLSGRQSDDIWLWTCNVSLLAMLIIGVFSLPRWQGVAGLVLTLAWVADVRYSCSTF
jgi:hypothetical protein